VKARLSHKFLHVNKLTELILPIPISIFFLM
jgi:hypothetical protein